MQLISNLKERSQHKREEEVKKMASEYITLFDFNSKLYIAFQGNPLISLDSSLTSSDILNKLSEARNNFINAKLNDNE